jgi:hypothetical protein
MDRAPIILQRSTWTNKNRHEFSSGPEGDYVDMLATLNTRDDQNKPGKVSEEEGEVVKLLANLEIWNGDETEEGNITNTGEDKGDIDTDSEGVRNNYDSQKIAMNNNENLYDQDDIVQREGEYVERNGPDLEQVGGEQCKHIHGGGMPRNPDHWREYRD